MVNTTSWKDRRLTPWRVLSTIVAVYLAIVIATFVVLGLLSQVAPHQAPKDAWVHAIVVAVFAVVLPFRLRAARAGSIRALRAVGLISAALLVANTVEAQWPGFVPGWMQVEMLSIAVLMAGAVLAVVWQRLDEQNKVRA